VQHKLAALCSIGTITDIKLTTLVDTHLNQGFRLIFYPLQDSDRSLNTYVVLNPLSIILNIKTNLRVGKPL